MARIAVRDRGGNVTYVEESQAQELFATGFYQPVRTASVMPGVTKQTAPEWTQNLDATNPGWIDNLGSNIADWWYSRVNRYGRSAFGPSPQRPEDQGTLSASDVQDDRGDEPAWLSQQGLAYQGHYSELTPEERRQADEYWRRMQNSNMFWDRVPMIDPETGQYMLDENGLVMEQRTKTQIGEYAIEQDGEDMGFSDKVIAAISAKYNEWQGDDRPALAQSDMAMYDPSRFGGPGGSGGGGGPKYVAPMRSVVEDTIKSMLVALTGQATEKLIQEYADIYEKAHKEQWDIRFSGGTDVDPNQVVLDKIRSQSDYARIHKLRPDSVDETSWIGQRSQRLQQLGVTAGDADEQAIWLAQTGTNLNDIETGAFQTGKGRDDITLFNNLKNAATQIARQL